MTHSVPYLAQRFDRAVIAQAEAQRALEAAQAARATADRIAALDAANDAAIAARRAAGDAWALAYAALHRMDPPSRLARAA